MKVLGFAIIIFGVIIGYIGITGSQHRIMAIIKNGPAVKSGKKVNPSGAGNTPSSNNSGTLANAAQPQISQNGSVL